MSKQLDRHPTLTEEQQSRLADLQARIAARPPRPPAPPLRFPPRYDEVYFEGVAWLESLA